MSVSVPPGKQTFLDPDDGKLLSLGTVTHYVPSTTTFKNTWADEAQTQVNQNPIPLDASASCSIWGEGLYRQIVRDVDGNLVWDRVTGFSSISPGGNDVLDSIATAMATAIPISFRAVGVTLLGYYAPNDGGGATYRYATIQAAGPGKFQSLDGAYWQIAEVSPNIRMFGAKGDGVTNDRAAILAGLQSSDVVTIPYSDLPFYVGSNLTMPADTQLVGPGTIKTGATAEIICSNRCRLEGFTIDGNGHVGSGVRVSNAADVDVAGLTIKDTYSSGVVVSGSSSIRVTGNRIDNTGNGSLSSASEMMGMYISASDGVLVEGNHISRPYGQAGVFVNVSDNLSINGNIIENTFYAGVRTFGACLQVQICNNKISKIGELNNTGSGIGCNGIFAADPNTTYLVSGNMISDVAENGIEVGTGLIIGNTIKTTGYRSLTTTSKEGIFVISDVGVFGNTIIDAVDEGVFGFGSIERALISGNLVKNSGNGGIRLQANGVGGVLADIVVSANMIIYDPADPTKTAIQAAATAGATTTGAVQVFGNSLVGTALTSVVEDNRFVRAEHTDTWGYTAPVAGTWNLGDRVWNLIPGAGGTLGWICITAGTPGTWKIFGSIAP